ncbi:MAG: DegV family protein [Erysipelotrichaceae bacterium]
MKIITDTGSLITQAEAKSLDIELLPLQVEVSGKSYKDYFEISSENFVELIKKDNPSSSQPAIGDVLNLYEQKQDSLHIAMTKGLSSTYESALGLLNQMNASYITLFNSKTLAGTQKYLVYLAKRLSNNHSVEEIIERMNLCLKQCQSFLIPVDFNFLRRGGRLSPLAATLIGVFKIKPIVTHKPGMEKLERFGMGRTYGAAFDQIIDKMIENGVNLKHKIYISHAFNEEAAKLALTRIKAKIHDIEVELLNLSPVMITQGGPGCVAIQYILKDDND